MKTSPKPLGKMNATSPAIPRMNEATAALFPDAVP